MSNFLKHVKKGLKQKPKKLSSRYFYDARGDEFFREIMQLDEYYLPEYELDIIKNKSANVAKDISKEIDKLHVIELGAGDGTKTKFLLEAFTPFFKKLSFTALDISNNVLKINEREIKNHLPNIEYHFKAGNYFNTYNEIKNKEDEGKLILFLGANIGNFLLEESIDFFNFIKKELTHKDYFLVAFDLVKHPKKILKAYDDNSGITKKFNLNLLHRINSELGANIDVSKFDHYASYNPETGDTKSYIISLEKQTIELKDKTVFHFDAFETIHTEISKKFFKSDIEHIAKSSNMNIAQKYFNANKEYLFVLFKPK